MRTVTMPAPFEGTVAEANRNFDTHNWGHSDEEIVCYNCEAKPWHVAASIRADRNRHASTLISPTVKMPADPAGL